MSDQILPSQYEVVWALPFKSQEFNEGPQLVQTLAGIELRLDHESDSGDYVWSTIMFRSVHAVAFTAHASCTREQVQAYDRLVKVNDSLWLKGLTGKPAGVQHYRIYFDEVGCFDIAASAAEAPAKE